MKSNYLLELRIWRRVMQNYTGSAAESSKHFFELSKLYIGGGISDAA